MDGSFVRINSVDGDVAVRASDIISVKYYGNAGMSLSIRTITFGNQIEEYKSADETDNRMDAVIGLFPYFVNINEAYYNSQNIVGISKTREVENQHVITLAVRGSPVGIRLQFDTYDEMCREFDKLLTDLNYNEEGAPLVAL